MSDAGPLCLGCTDLDHLVFLAAGDAALTRRARVASRLSAVVRFSRACGRYERQGALVDEAALEEAEARVPGRRAGLPLPAARARLGPRRAPITPADVQRTLAAQSTLLEALDLIDTGGPAWVVGSSADTLLPGATLLAGVYTWYDDHEDQQT